MTGPLEPEAGNGRRTVSSRDVAAAAHVSQSTVSRVINGHTNVLAQTRGAVERAMADLGYVPNAAARSLITRHTRLLGLVVSNITNGFYPEIIDAITSAALKDGYAVIVGSAGERPARRPNTCASLPSSAWKGPSSRPPSSEMPMRGSHCRGPRCRSCWPTGSTRNLDLDAVALDNREAGRVATRHLAEHDRRRIAYIGGHPDAATDQGRFAGYCLAMGEAGIDVQPGWTAHGEFTRAYGRARTAEILAGDASIDGIVAGDDTIALGCLDAIAEAGRRVSHDIGLVGFDDIPAASLRSVWLTTVSSAAHEMGAQALELLLDRVRDGYSGPPRRVILAPVLMVRGSCGAHDSSGQVG